MTINLTIQTSDKQLALERIERDISTAIQNGEGLYVTPNATKFIRETMDALRLRAEQQPTTHTDGEIREKWKELATTERRGCVIDSGSWAIELVRWALKSAGGQ